MAKEEKCEGCKECNCRPKQWHNHSGNMSGGIYFFAFIGAAVYFMQNSTGFWMGVLAILKAIVWPAYIVFKVLGILNI